MGVCLLLLSFCAAGPLCEDKEKTQSRRPMAQRSAVSPCARPRWRKRGEHDEVSWSAMRERAGDGRIHTVQRSTDGTVSADPCAARHGTSAPSAACYCERTVDGMDVHAAQLLGMMQQHHSSAATKSCSCDGRWGRCAPSQLITLFALPLSRPCSGSIRLIRPNKHSHG
jgi:hypothetical protein